MTTTLTTALADRILTITLNRPDHLNAFTVEMADELVATYEQASLDDAVGAIVLTGAGRAFCAGMDLAARDGSNVFGLDETLEPTMDDMIHRLDDPAIVAGVRDTGGRVTLAMYACRKPIVAAINGAAVGIGATMTLAADFRLASEKARIGFVFGRIGIVPDACSSWFLPRLVGLPQALDWMLSGRTFGAEEARTAGLVRSLHAPDDLADAAQHIAREIAAQGAPVSVALTRRMLWQMAGAAHPMEAHRIESRALAARFGTADTREGMASFLEKRAPDFTGRVSADMPAGYPWWPREDF